RELAPPLRLAGDRPRHLLRLRTEAQHPRPPARFAIGWRGNPYRPRRNEVRKPSPAVVRLMVSLGVLVVLLAIAVALREVLLPLFLAMAIAYVANPAVTWFERRGHSRAAGTLVIALVLVLLATGFFLYLIPAISAQVRHLEERLPA